MNAEREIQKAIESNKAEMNKLSSGADVKTLSKYKTTLANEEMVTVYPFKKVPNTYRNNYVFASFMLDDNTAVTVSSTHDKTGFDEVLKTLKIGDLT